MSALWEPDAKREALKEPAKRWRNWWRGKCTAIVRCRLCGHLQEIGVGQVYANHCRTYPSRDVAETDHAKYFYPSIEDYLGAFPEGERP